MAPSFSTGATVIDAYDFLEVDISVPVARLAGVNPFVGAAVTGTLTDPAGRAVDVEGFCDSDDGHLFKVRFMPRTVGRHTYAVTYADPRGSVTHTGAFEARDGRRRGLVRVDPEHPFHFLWEGTGEHYFWNGTTCYWLAGWRDVRVIDAAIDRLARHKVNRIRVTLNGRHAGGQRWGEPLVQTGGAFSFRVDPWPSARPGPADHADPGFDVTRFDVAFWRRYEHVLRRAREHDIIVDVIFFTDGQDPGVDPFGKAGMGGPDERRYYRYAAARLGAFSNVCWDVTNEWRLFRTVEWVNATGAYLKGLDPYKHITSCHGHEDFPYRASAWCDFAMFQRWDESGGYGPMLALRREQAATGRPIPQVNEEYGYEDHYPVPWGGGKLWPARSASTRRRLAWEIYMAGCYQTTGERSDLGTAAGDDTGGGWINGRGSDDMTMLAGYAHIVTFFTALRWWRMDPRPDLVTNDRALCLAEPGRQYALYFPKPPASAVTLTLEPGSYEARLYNPRTGQYLALGTVTGPTWTVPTPPDVGDWAVSLVGQ